ncbi:MAG: hypothetical protein ACRBN8_29840 [Nannocystales bacterium]
MKIRRIPLAGLVLLAACASSPDASPVEDNTSPDAVRLELSTDRVYEVGALWLAPGEEAALGEFVGSAFPLAIEEYGLEPLVSVQPAWSSSGEPPDTLFINSWPSRAEYEAFIADPRFTAVEPKRARAVTDMFVSVFSVQEDESILVEPGESLSIAGVWGERAGDDWARALRKDGHVPLALELVDQGEFGPSLAGLVVSRDEGQLRATIRDAGGGLADADVIRTIGGPLATE